MDASDHIILPAGYLESRARFRQLGTWLDAELRSFPHPAAEDNAHGVAGLSTDTAYLGARDADTVVVIASGTHGVEGYAGAACQFRFMQGWRERQAHASPESPAWLLVHAVNPWGFLHDRRVTPEGVDLNRNFIDFNASRDPASSYDAYHAMLVADFRPLPAGLFNELRLLSWGLTRARRRSLQDAVTGGQYGRPQGLFYGGSGPVQSRRVWEAIVDAYLPARRKAFLLDLHTGLGRRGHGELISYLPPSHPDFLKMNGWFAGALKSMAAGDSVSAAVQGTLTAAFDRAVAGQSYAVGLEFGTRSALAVLNALRYDHWYHNNAARLGRRQREAARRRMKQAFAAADERWLQQVIERFDQVVAQVAAGLARDRA